jgi:hypothetical protein
MPPSPGWTKRAPKNTVAVSTRSAAAPRHTPCSKLSTCPTPTLPASAQALARRILENGGATDDARITYAFRLCVARPPAPDEQADLKSFLTEQRNRIAEGWLEPWKIATGTNQPSTVPKGATPTQLAAYTALSRVLLNLDETITKE